MPSFTAVYLFIYPANDGRIMCLCRDVIYWFCLVRSLCSEWHKSGLHYAIKGPLMQHAFEHDGFGEDEQSFEGKQRSVSVNALCPSLLLKSSTDWTESMKNEPSNCWRKAILF